MVVFSLDLGFIICLLLFLFLIVGLRLYVTITDWKDKCEAKKVTKIEVKEATEIISDAPSGIRTGRFKLVPHGVKEYVLYAEYEKWTGDLHNTYADRKYQPANADDVRFYYQQKTNELP